MRAAIAMAAFATASAFVPSLLPISSRAVSLLAAQRVSGLGTHARAFLLERERETLET
jgi:hypothetical protein